MEKTLWKRIVEDKRAAFVFTLPRGLMFAPDGSVSFIFTVDERDTVAPNGKTYSGTFDFKLWPPVFSEVDTGKPLQEIKGTTAGTRIPVD
jgi:hypothetical protein